MSDTNERTEAFRRHYEDADSHWANSSGPGSTPFCNIEYRAFFERFIHLNGIRSVVDIGCGDWQFSRYLNFEGVQYYGFDVVPSVVERNQRLFGAPNINFALAPPDLADIPSADLLVMKDVLQHLPDSEIMRYKIELFDRYPCCLLSNSYRKLGSPVNTDIPYGSFRNVDLNSPPYNFGGHYVIEYSSECLDKIRTMLYVPQTA